MLKKTTGKLALSLLGSAIVAEIMCIIVTISVNMLIKGLLGTVLSLVLGLAIFLVMIYNPCWEEGFRDPNRVKNGHMKKFLAKGLVAGLLADIPSILFYIVFLYSWITNQNYKIIQFIYRFLNLQYLLFLDQLFAYPYLMIVLCLPLPVTAGVAYLLGYKQISLSSKIVYKNKKEIARKTR